MFAVASDLAFESSPLHAPEPMVRLQADRSGGLLAVSGKGVLWRLGSDTAGWQRLGDGIESTRVLYLERHALSVLRSLDVPAPYVIEDIAPRPIGWRERTGLLTMRSGLQGAQLVVIAASPGASDRLELVALGPPIGTPNRWLAGTTDGKRLLAVHTPHIGGVLHEYKVAGAALSARSIADGVSNHRIGSRELDLAVWIGARVMLPAGDWTSFRCFDGDAGWSDCGSVALGKAAVASAALAQRGRTGVAVLTADGQLTFVVPRR